MSENDGDGLPRGRDLGPLQIGCKRCGRVHWESARLGECQPRTTSVRPTSAAIAYSLAARRRALGWPDSTPEERERNLRDIVDGLVDL